MVFLSYFPFAFAEGYKRFLDRIHRIKKMLYVQMHTAFNPPFVEKRV